MRLIPNPTLKRDCAKARSPLAPRYASRTSHVGNVTFLLRLTTCLLSLANDTRIAALVLQIINYDTLFGTYPRPRSPRRADEPQALSAE